MLRAPIQHISFYALLLWAVQPVVCLAAPPCPAPTIGVDAQPVATTPCTITPPPHFPQVSDFVGTRVANDVAANGAPVLGGTSNYVGHVVFAGMSRADVKAVLAALAPDLQLAAASTTSTTPDSYPVVLMFGWQSQLAWDYSFVAIPTPQFEDYRELILLIPFVQLSNGSIFHNYVARMYLDWPVDYLLTRSSGIDVGNEYYGYEKRPADFRPPKGGSSAGVAIAPLSPTPSPQPAGLEEMTVCSTTSPRLPRPPNTPPPACDASSAGKQFTVRTWGEGYKTDADASKTAVNGGLTNYQTLKDILSMPVLGTCDDTILSGGVCGIFGPAPLLGWASPVPQPVSVKGHMCSYFVFDWHQTRKETAEFALLSDFDFPAGTPSPWLLQKLGNVPDGAFGVQLKWQLTLSEECH